MRVTLTLDADLVRRVRKIAAERKTTLTGMVREHLERTVAERAALERSFKAIKFHIGQRTWTRADLHVRS
jgi:predicted transcriptional regulator